MGSRTFQPTAFQRPGIACRSERRIDDDLSADFHRAWIGSGLAPRATIGFQAVRRRRGGWNTSLPFCTGRRAVVSSERKEGPVEAKHGISMHQAQESSRPSHTPAGTDGAAGWPEHHVPEHGSGDEGTGSGSDRPAKSKIKGSIREESRPGSVREVTRWLQPAQADPGAEKPWTRRSRKAQVPNRASRLNGMDLIKPLPPSEQTQVGGNQPRNWHT
jgi:hypothetical protein